MESPACETGRKPESPSSTAQLKARITAACNVTMCTGALSQQKESADRPRSLFRASTQRSRVLGVPHAKGMGKSSEVSVLSKSHRPHTRDCCKKESSSSAIRSPTDPTSEEPPTVLIPLWSSLLSVNYPPNTSVTIARNLNAKQI